VQNDPVTKPKPYPAYLDDNLTIETNVKLSLERQLAGNKCDSTADEQMAMGECSNQYALNAALSVD
jgi:hypothetical protein